MIGARDKIKGTIAEVDGEGTRRRATLCFHAEKLRGEGSKREWGGGEGGVARGS